MEKTINVVGAGLAGSEAAYQLAKRGYKVNLYEMRPKKLTEAHKTGMFGELICSNSLRASSLENAVGLLKAEMEELDSLIIKAARATCLEAGGALAVDRELFSGYITKELKENPLINIIEEEVLNILKGRPLSLPDHLPQDHFIRPSRISLAVVNIFISLMR
jgi:methylenetetrahydrofolate--tRNA-(uracil-5-)-methyltransferase